MSGRPGGVQSVVCGRPKSSCSQAPQPPGQEEGSCAPTVPALLLCPQPRQCVLWGGGGGGRGGSLHSPGGGVACAGGCRAPARAPCPTWLARPCLPRMACPHGRPSFPQLPIPGAPVLQTCLTAPGQLPPPPMPLSCSLLSLRPSFYWSALRHKCLGSSCVLDFGVTG